MKQTRRMIFLRYSIGLFLTMICAATAIAQDTVRSGAPMLIEPPKPALAAGVANANQAGNDGGRLALTQENCHALIAGSANAVTQSTTGDAAYQPGVDVYGSKVAPADLPADQSAAPYLGPVTTQIILPTAMLGRYPASLGQASETYPAFVTVDPTTGAVKLNNQPLDNGQTQTLRSACLKQGWR